MRLVNVRKSKKTKNLEDTTVTGRQHGGERAGNNVRRTVMAVETASVDETEGTDVDRLCLLEHGSAGDAVVLAQTEVVNVLEPRVPPLCATVTLGQMLRMEVDTGAVYSVMDDVEFKRRFPTATLQQSYVKLRGYLRQQAAVAGKATGSWEGTLSCLCSW